MIKEYDCLRGPSFQLAVLFFSLVKIERCVRLKTNLIIKNVDRDVKLKKSIELYESLLAKKWKKGQKKAAAVEISSIAAVL